MLPWRKRSMRVAVIGCGLIGTRRAKVAVDSGDEVVVVADISADRAQAVAEATRSKWTVSWPEIVSRDDIDVVVVSTSNDLLAEASIAALESGKHVLCEKPLGRNAAEATAIVAAAQAAGRLLKVGFNHRHHPAIAAARELVGEGAIGDVFAIRALYGHGGRAGYEREWRANPARSGGGELLDQGVHIVDLARWFIGEIAQAQGYVGTYHWPIQPVEDNAFALLRASSGGIVSFHTSWTQWKNAFRFEVLGTGGYLRIDGLGGSYGTERLTLAKRNEDSSPPVEETTSFEGPDQSWRSEWQEFSTAIGQNRQPLGNGDDGLAAARILDAIYESAASGNAVEVAHA
ncbi:MAG: Gfo/Idh/MocA family oxidoreductase [Candidatus Limnocylindrales bacterium]